MYKKLNPQHIVLVMPSHSNFTLPIIQNLKHHQYQVTYIDSSPDHLEKLKLSLLDNSINLFKKWFFKDSSYKNQKKSQLKEDLISFYIQSIPVLNEQDFILVIRPDLVSIENLKKLRLKTRNNLIAYQWNGLDRFPKTLNTLSLFDHFFIFDPTDVQNKEYSHYQLKGITNFYFDLHQPKFIKQKQRVAYFVGLHFDERIETLENCAKLLNQFNIFLNLNILIIRDKEKNKAKYSHPEIHFITEGISFEANLDYINSSDILIDILNPVHKGLSFRTFEALYYQKKLITSNEQIKYYDFYHPNNIFIWHESNLHELEDFLVKPYVEIDVSIVQKYSFHNWLKNILNLKPFEQIHLP